MSRGALLGVLLLGEGVQQGAEHRHSRADAAQSGDGGLEHDAGSHDDDHSLQGVGHLFTNSIEQSKNLSTTAYTRYKQEGVSLPSE